MVDEWSLYRIYNIYTARLVAWCTSVFFVVLPSDLSSSVKMCDDASIFAGGGVVIISRGGYGGFASSRCFTLFTPPPSEESHRTPTRMIYNIHWSQDAIQYIQIFYNVSEGRGRSPSRLVSHPRRASKWQVNITIKITDYKKSFKFTIEGGLSIR